MLPKPLETRLQAQLEQDYPNWVRSLAEPAPVSIRYNPSKPYPRADLPVVPWWPDAVYLLNRPAFVFDPLWHSGAYYVQEASSMLVGFLAQPLLKNIEAPNVLDLCAAPGGKSTHLLSLLNTHGLLIANEVIKSRAEVLLQNIMKQGSAQAVVTSADPSDFSTLSGFFDVVVVDAPCSGEGLLRKQPDAVLEWSPEAVAHCAARQNRILEAAAPLVAQGGYLIYSTCTHSTEENEDRISALLETGMWQVELPALPDAGIVAGSLGWRCYPHRVAGEGFFVSCLKRTGQSNETHKIKRNLRFNWVAAPKTDMPLINHFLAHPDFFRLLAHPKLETRFAAPSHLLARIATVASATPLKYFGLAVGSMKGSTPVPDHALALSDSLSGQITRLELPKEEALRFLKKETLDASPTSSGWSLATYQQVGLGWLKAAGNRYNNYLPTHWRIRLDLPPGML
jgi:16S rRNA C967 or C1407 C5-methylase (RsmB/RsmF family)/NOL1/NOP2/fmu family ribosome biogenesis protein